MATKHISHLKEAARGLISMDRSELSTDEKNILNKAYSVINKHLKEKTGKEFMELEYPNATIKY